MLASPAHKHVLNGPHLGCCEPSLLARPGQLLDLRDGLEPWNGDAMRVARPDPRHGALRWRMSPRGHDITHLLEPLQALGALLALKERLVSPDIICTEAGRRRDGAPQ